MTQPVPTNGFMNLPSHHTAPAPSGNPPPGPGNSQEPGWVSQNPAPAPAAAAPDATVPPAPAMDMAAAVAALSAALTAQAPQTPPASAPVVPDGKAAPQGNTVLTEVGSDPILKSMAALLRTSAKGIDLDRVLGNAIEHGNTALIDVAYLKEVAGENAVELLTVAQGMVEAINAKANGLSQEVHALAGGEANWDACASAFNTKAQPELKAVIVQMLDSRNPAQVKAAAKLVVDFAKGTGFVPTPAVLIANGGAAPLVGQGLSKGDFQIELAKLNKNDRNYAQQRAELFARRTAGKQAGK